MFLYLGISCFIAALSAMFIIIDHNYNKYDWIAMILLLFSIVGCTIMLDTLVSLVMTLCHLL